MPPRESRNRPRPGGARQRRDDSSMSKSQITYVPPVKGEQERKYQLTNDSGTLPGKAPANGSPVVLKRSPAQ